MRNSKPKKLNRAVIFLAAAVVAAFGAVDLLEQGRFAAGIGLTLVSLGLCCYVIYLSHARLRMSVLGGSLFEAWDYSLTREGFFYLLIVVVVGVAALLSGNNLLYLILSCLLAAMIVSGFVSRLVLSGLQLDVRLPNAVFARQSFHLSVALQNLKRQVPSYSIWISTPVAPKRRRRGRARRKDDPVVGAPTGPRLDPQPIYCPLIAGRGKATASTPAVFPQRGRFESQVFWLRTKFPFSFVERRARVTPTKQITVYPSIESSRAVDKMIEGLEAEHLAHTRGESHDLYRIRPGQSEDGARFVDWKATARTGEVMVREFTRDDRGQVEIIFDPSSPPQSSALSQVDDTTFEKTVQQCAALVWRLAQAGTEIRFRSGEIRILSAAPSDVFGILGFLAAVQPEPPRDQDEQAPLARDAAADVPRFIFSAMRKVPTARYNLERTSP